MKKILSIVMPLKLFKAYYTVHNQFVLRANPYVSFEEAEETYFRYIGFTLFATSTVRKDRW